MAAARHKVGANAVRSITRGCCVRVCVCVCTCLGMCVGVCVLALLIGMQIVFDY